MSGGIGLGSSSGTQLTCLVGLGATPASIVQMHITDHTYAYDELPREIEVQILAFMRIVWADIYASENRFRSRLWQSPGAVHLVRSADDILVSHVKLQPITGRSAEGDVPIAGVGGVMTYPQFRGEGH